MADILITTLIMIAYFWIGAGFHRLAVSSDMGDYSEIPIIVNILLWPIPVCVAAFIGE